MPDSTAFTPTFGYIFRPRPPENRLRPHLPNGTYYHYSTRIVDLLMLIHTARLKDLEPQARLFDALEKRTSWPQLKLRVL